MKKIIFNGTNQEEIRKACRIAGLGCLESNDNRLMIVESIYNITIFKDDILEIDDFGYFQILKPNYVMSCYVRIQS